MLFGKSVDLKPSNKKNERLGIFNQIKGIKNLHVVTIIIVSSLVYFSGMLSTGFISIYLFNELQIPNAASVWGFMNAATTIAGIVVAYAVGRFWHGKFRYSVIYSILSFILLQLTFLIINDPLILFLVYCIPASVGIMIAAPEIITEIIPEEERGLAMGIVISTQNFALGLGAISGGTLGALTGTLKINFLVGTITCLVSLLIALLFIKNVKSRQDINE